MKLREMILVSFLAAMALVFNMLESALPMPLPGIKLGTANVFALAAIILAINFYRDIALHNDPVSVLHPVVRRPHRENHR